MKRYVSVWDMHKGRSGFTLIEVMISVVIISTVIMALIELFSNNTHIFASLSKKNQTSQSLSFMMSNKDYGFKDEKISLNDLLQDFDLETDLRRKLKDSKVEIIYQEVDTIDMSEFDGSNDEEEIDDTEESKESNSNMVFEIGKTVLKSKDSSSSMLRIQVQ